MRSLERVRINLLIMGIHIVFETHSISEDNERGIATGWHHGMLSQEGRRLAREIGQRRYHDNLQAIFSSDLRRAVETVEIALGATTIPILYDWRLRECDHGDRNGWPTSARHYHRREHLDEPYPHGQVGGRPSNAWSAFSRICTSAGRVLVY